MLAAALRLTALAAVAVAAADETRQVFSGTAKSAVTGDFAPNECSYEEFSDQFVSAAESRFAYVSASRWEATKMCGRCANVTLSPAKEGLTGTPNSTVTVMIISSFDDECGGSRRRLSDDSDSGSDIDSDSGSEGESEEFVDDGDERDCTNDLLLSDQAYRDMLNQGSGSRFSVDWEFVQCPSDFVDGGIEFGFDDATTPNLITVQPRNFLGQIGSLEVEFEDGAVFPLEPAFGSYQSVVLTDGQHLFSQPFKLVVTEAETNESYSVEITEQPVPNQVIVTDVQFKQ